jgi:tetratricopeptide (TPR) repeat protein/predicted Ser/Thr protein kinase
MASTLISHYRLLDQLGDGGMGVVYRAEDIWLGREVAIKLLRTEAVHSREWLGRFEREARLASSLQHPHICMIHELGEHEGQPFIVMERLEGRTMRQIIEDGPIPPDRVIHFARQIADALDAAHRRGIIHRDIKPANLFVTFGDHLKVLDFGLAKVALEDAPSPSRSATGSSPTLVGTFPADLTRTGDTVGTAAYMSPEQSHGLPLDARTDLFSLGSVLYEMATGRRAFGGEDLQLIVMKINNGIIIPLQTVNAAIPDSLNRIILRLLAVDPQMRYQTAAELGADLESAAQQFERAPAPAPAAPAAAPAHRRTAVARWAIPIALAAVVIAGFTGWKRFTAGGAALTDRDTLMVGTFENATSDPVFDQTLDTALKVQLGQSPFLELVPDSRLSETLRLMRQADEKLSHVSAREACQRMGARAMLEGSIAPLGTNYVITLSATDCQTGETLAREQAEATNRERVLKELGTISSSIRTRLGESLRSIQRFDMPIEQATTPSLPALKSYSLGLEERRRGRELESMAFFNQAIELDHDFASAYATLSTVYGSLGEWEKSEEAARVAFGLQNRVSERERLFITYQYHDRVTGNEERAAETLEAWKNAFPRDSRPANALALIHNRMGRYDRAESEAQEALRRSPGHPFPLSNLAIAYRSMGRYADAKKVADEAVALGVETTPTRRLLYQLAVLAGDGPGAAAQLVWAKDKPREFDLVSAQAQIAAYEGRLKEAGDLYRRAADLAIARNLKGTASGYAAHLAWTEALYRSTSKAAENVRRVVALIDIGADPAGTVPRFREAAAYALAGLPNQAQALVSRAEQRYPESTLVRTVLGPTTRAANAVRQGRPDVAIAALDAATPSEFGTVAGLVPTYLRAEALLQKGATADALREYNKILEHRGIDPFAPVVPLAHLGIARARARAGDTAGSRRAYEELFTLWHAADVDLWPLREARTEYGRLSSSTSALTQ